jgi:hypothetical protein
MRILLSLSFLVLFTTQQSYGQNVNADMKAKWAELTKQLKVRANKVEVFTNDLLKIESVKKEAVSKANTKAKSFIAYVDATKKLDSGIVKTTFRNNKILTNAVMMIMTTLEDLKDEAVVNKFDKFFGEMDVIEKTINAAKRNYNAACKLNKMIDCEYTNPEPDEDVKVDF